MNLSSLTEQLVLALPPDELALRVLRAITDGETARGFFFGKDRVITPSGGHGREYQQRLEEAFAWMQREVWIAKEPSQSSPNWFFVTRLGWTILQDPAGLERAQTDARLRVDLHPRLATRVRSQFLLGEYEAAAFLSMREVEITVREQANADAGDIGVALMKSAFAKDGPLTDAATEPGEQQARMALYWGAIGMFKNPSSHRQVDFDDPIIASEVILLADLLLRLLDQSNA
ncbi:MAG: TIGR02391 family protein [Solirubrobacterales bacterium]|jgi:uncharacterized protein (TIGR02391 family)|nr:TIGR02391 family protein [Solirubrobacterales bacterium]